MGLELKQVVPWGRSFAEYVQMFGLTDADLQRSILDCAAGPASFNAEMTQQGHRVISCDPLYQFLIAEIEQRIEETYSIIVEGTRAHRDSYVWQTIASPDQLGEIRMAAMRQFLADFATDRASRYQPHELPNLPYGDRQFDLALCSHFLFGYSAQFSTQFHIKSVLELCRVAPEVRIFPLLTVSGNPSPHLPTVRQILHDRNITTRVQTVPYEFQKGGNQMLVCKGTGSREQGIGNRE